jgi:WD40 repeat protein
VPRDLEVICLKCLEKDPRRRYASADALAEDLKRNLAGEPIAARPVGNTARLWMWCRRNPALAGTVGLLIMALVAVAVLSLLSADRQARLAAAEKLRGDEQARHAEDQAQAAARLKSALADSNGRLAILDFERAEASFDREEIGSGLLWLVESLRNANDAENPAWKHLALANLSSWSVDYPELREILLHGAGVSSVAISPDGKTVVTGGEDNRALVWDAGTPRPMAHRSNIVNARLSGLAFSPDGKRILTGSWDGTTQLWDVATARPVGDPITADDPVLAVAFSPDDKTVLTGQSHRGARLWDLATRLPIGEPMIHEGAMVQAVAFSPDGRKVLTGSQDSTAQLWDAATGRPIGPRMRHHDQISAVAFSPDGQTLLTGSDDKTARLWNATTQEAIGKPLVHGDWVWDVAFSPDGRTVLTGSGDKLARLWDIATGLPACSPMEHQGAVAAVAFGPDGKAVITGSQDATVRLWSRRKGPPTGRRLDHQGLALTWAFSPDGKTLLTGHQDNTGRLWDIATGRPIGTPLQHQGPVSAVAFSPDGKMVLTGAADGMARLWDVAGGRLVGPPIRHRDGNEAPGESQASRANSDVDVRVVAFSPAGKSILTGGGDWTARMWDVASGRPVGKPINPHGVVRAAAFSPDGKTILTGTDRVNLWDAETGRLLCRIPPSGGRLVDAISFSPDGRTILVAFGPLVAIGPYIQLDQSRSSIANDGIHHPATIGRWQMRSGPELAPVGQSIEVPGGQTPLALSPDQTTAVLMAEVGGAKLWHLTTNQLIRRIHEYEGFVRAAAFSPDGRTLFVGGDGAMRLWDVATGQPIGKPMPYHGQVVSIGFSPNGKTILTRALEGSRLWDVPEPIPDDLPRITLWVQVMTGMELDDQGSVRSLDGVTWRQRRKQLTDLGGFP